MPYKDPAQKRAYQRRWMADRRSQYAAGQTCAGCGNTQNLHLHHREESRKVSHRIWSWSKSRLEKELDKCTWLCATCHMRHHKAKPNAHGTVNMYKRYKCRCGECRAAKAADDRKYRQVGKRPGF